MVKPKSFRPWNPEQTLLLPPSPVDWLPENHLVFFLLDLAGELDLEGIHAIYQQKDPRGEKAYDPRMMVELRLYAYCVGLSSSRKIEKACWEDAASRVLSGNQQPDHSRISDRRRRHLDVLAGLFVQVLRLCRKAGRVSPGQVAQDGTKIRANASKHKAMSHERMLNSERQLEGERRALLRKAEIIDAQEDGQVGKGKRGDELPEDCSDAPAGWRGSARPRLNWKPKLLQPRPLNGMTRPRLLSRTPKHLRPVAMSSARSPPMQLATPNRSRSGISPIPTATSSRDRTAGFRVTTPRPPSIVTFKESWPSRNRGHRREQPAQRRGAPAAHAGADPLQHRSVAGGFHCRCRLLQHRQPESLRGEGTGGLHLHQPAAARPEAQAIKGPTAPRP